jgi:uncharacterized protein (DUF885 family)
MKTSRRIACLLLFTIDCLAASPVNVAQEVNDLADRYVSAMRETYPLVYAGSGLPNPRRDLFDINSPQDLAVWRDFLKELDRDAKSVDPKAIEGQPAWLTLAQLRQAIEQHRAAEVCRTELWSVHTYGWHATLALIAELQPVGDAAKREAILTRFSKLPRFVDQEILNLRQGVSLGYTSPRLVVEAVLSNLDNLLDEPLAKTVYYSPAERDTDETFRVRWTSTLKKVVAPALARYRDFLRAEYLPRARSSPSIIANTNGKNCFRAVIAANSSVSVDPIKLFERLNERADQEVQTALLAGKKRYGRDFLSLTALAEALRKDSRNHFNSKDQVHEFIVSVMRRGKAGAAKVVPLVPDVDVEVKPFSDAAGESAPSGQYIPRDTEGRPPIYYYRTDYANLSPSSLEATVLHETWPGHHLQAEITQGSSKFRPHPLAQLVFLPGVGEGWATYVEGLARDLSLYDSELGVIGSVMNSMTPRAVADIGMHVFGWSEQRTLDYLKGRFPATPAERVQLTVTAIADEPGLMVPYALGAVEIENMREEMRRVQGDRFDLRQFHQRVIEDGTVPFPALRSKLGLGGD